VLVDAATLREAERLIESCEHPEGAEIPFDVILDRVTGSDPARKRRAVFELLITVSNGLELCSRVLVMSIMFIRRHAISIK